MKIIFNFGIQRQYLTFDSSWIRDEYRDTANVRDIKKVKENQK